MAAWYEPPAASTGEPGWDIGIAVILGLVFLLGLLPEILRRRR